MQYHYVVGYDTESKKWFIDPDLDAYFPNGSVWDNDKSESSDYFVSGWIAPEDVTPEQSALDMEILHTLESVIDTFPIHN